MLTVVYTVALALFLFLIWWKARKSIAGVIDRYIATLISEIEEARKLKEASQQELTEIRALERVRREELVTLVDTTRIKCETMSREFEERFESAAALKKRAMTKRIKQMEERLERQFRQNIAETAIAVVEEIVKTNLDLAKKDTQRRLKAIGQARPH